MVEPTPAQRDAIRQARAKRYANKIAKQEKRRAMLDDNATIASVAARTRAVRKQALYDADSLAELNMWVR